MEISGYQAFKLFLTELLGISRDGFHLVLTYLIFLLIGMLFKWRLSSWKMLFAPLIFAVILEIADTRDAVEYGFGIDYFDSIHDFIIGMLLPFLTVIYAKAHEKAHVEK